MEKEQTWDSPEYKSEVSENVIQERKSICNSCDLLSSLKICKQCGCFMPIKIRLGSVVKCPLEKW